MIKEIDRSIKQLVDANGGYCPCAIEQTADTRCMCKEFREMDEGVCHCGRFQKVNAAKNPYWERVCAIAQKQREKGQSKYGFGLEDNPAGIIERINHLQEELIDALMYCEWIMDYIKVMEDDAK